MQLIRKIAVLFVFKSIFVWKYIKIIIFIFKNLFLISTYQNNLKTPKNNLKYEKKSSFFLKNFCNVKTIISQPCIEAIYYLSTSSNKS